MKTISSFFLIILSYIAFTYLNDNFILSSSYLESQISLVDNPVEVSNLIYLKSEFYWSSYLVKIVTVIVRMLYVSFCLYVGSLILNIEVDYKIIFDALVKSELIFLFAELVNFVVLYIGLNDFSFEFVMTYYSLSFLSFIGIGNINFDWAILPLQMLNLYQIFHMFLVAFFLEKRTQKAFLDMLNLTVPSQGIGLFLLIILFSFLAFQFS